MTSLDSRRNLAIFWLSLFSLALLRTAWVGDDAYFTFRTIDNFVHGYGLRWNVAERVQAYTHPLWMLLLTPFYWITGEPFFTSIAISSALTLITIWLLLRRAPSAWTAAAGLTVLLASRAFIDYSTSGLENPLTHLLLVLFLGRALNEHRATTPTVLLAALLLLNRLDLSILVLPVLLPLIPWRAPRQTSRTLLLGFLPLIAWELFSIVYYGFFVPNTAFAKVKTGVAERELFKQGVTYLLDSIERDPLTLLVTCAVAVWTVWISPRRTRSVGIAILLHLAALTYAGGDFMSGRLLAAPFVAAVVVLMRVDIAALFAYRWMAVALAAIIGFQAFRAITIGQSIADARDVLAASGVSDERASYFRTNGLIAYSRDAPYWPRSKWIEDGLQTRAAGPSVIPYCCNGMLGYAAGPAVHILDLLGLGDPLMARLPSRSDWRIGHFDRDLPSGYGETVQRGENRITNPHLATYYSRLALITRGPIFDRRRLATIARMNLGGYEWLLERARSATPGCWYVLLHTKRLMAPEGGRASFTAQVNSQGSGCRWRAAAAEPWIRIADAAGVGSGTVNFTVDANRTAAPRAGTITVSWPDGSATYGVSQNGVLSCSFALAPQAQKVDASGKDFNVTVAPSNPSCGWKADSDVPWIAITSGQSNTGVGTVVYTVQANGTRAERAGGIRVTGLVSGQAALVVTQRP